jgi:hypothetical protein
MKKLKFTLILLCISFVSFAQVQVGIGTVTPQSSAVLDLTATDKALLLPRVANTAAITAPKTGMLIYDLSSNCTRLYGKNAWSDCIGAVTSQSVSNNCDSNGFEGAYATGFAMTTTNKFTVTVTNNSFTSATISFATGDLVLSGVTGLTVSAVSPATATLIAGQTQVVTYTLTGTPAAAGTLTGTWTKLSLSCVKTKVISGISGLVNSNYCTNATVNGTYISAVAFTASNTFTVTLTNTTGVAITGMPAPTIANLTRSFTGTGTINVASVSPSASFNLAIGASQTITYTLSGTPTSTGVLSLDWAYGDLTCAKTKNVELGNATFSQSKLNQYAFSVNDPANSIVVQGTLNSSTTGLMPYTSGVGTYLAYTSADVAIPAAYCEDGASDWTLGYSYPAGVFSTSGNITVTFLIKKGGVLTNWPAKRVESVATINFDIATIPWSVNGNTYSITVGIDEGGDAIRGGLSQGGCASCVAYDAAAVGSLVKVTSAEYAASFTLVAGSGKYSTNDALLNGTNGTNAGPFAETASNGVATNLTPLIPASNYIYGLAANCLANPSSKTIKFKYSTSNNTGFVDIGTNPSVTPSATAGVSYWVVKRSPILSTAASYLAIWANSVVLSFNIGIVGATGVPTQYFAGNDVNTGFSAWSPNSGIRIQALSTATKQW